MISEASGVQCQDIASESDLTEVLLRNDLNKNQRDQYDGLIKRVSCDGLLIDHQILVYRPIN